MEEKLSDLEPKKVFSFFEELTKIPRGSGNEKAVSDFLVDFASRRGLIAYQDEKKNVTILKPATDGMEEKPTVILQAHMDMVAVKDDDSAVDPAKEALDVYVDGDFVKARGTSLGADDGIGVAFILAILDSDDISHPMIEAVFTADEEEGLGGAYGYDCSRLKGKRLINIDTEEENHIVNGCAGGVCCDLSSKCKTTKEEGTVYDIAISNLTGGHSGTEIHKGGANANVLMGRFLLAASRAAEFFLSTYEGGTKDNAICTSAKATVVVKKKNGKAFEKCIKAFGEEILALYGKTDPDFVVKCKDKGKGKLEVMSSKDFSRFVAILNQLPNGVIKMSQSYDMVETSANIGVVSAKPKSYSITVSLRSNRDMSLEWMIAKAEMLAKAYDVSFAQRGMYPAWESSGDDFARSAKQLYERMFSRNIDIVTIHAGLECALFSKKIKDLEVISIGPDLSDVHTTSESLSISSTQREWQFIKELIRL